MDTKQSLYSVFSSAIGEEARRPRPRQKRDISKDNMQESKIKYSPRYCAGGEIAGAYIPEIGKRGREVGESQKKKRKKKQARVCGPLLKTLTLFKAKICDFSYPIYDL